jgi:hypothetical protein
MLVSFKPVQENIMLELAMPGIRCMFCVVRLKAAIRKIDPGLRIGIDSKAGRISLARPEDRVKVERALAYLDGLANG